jgi:hypothetical protein
MTIAAWVRPAAITGSHDAVVVYGQGADDSDATWFRLNVNASAARAVLSVNNTTALATASAPVVGQWQHLAAVFASSTGRTAYRNGAAGSENTTSLSPVRTPNACLVGRLPSTINANWFNGDIAHVAIWSASLTAGEIASLASGASPLLVRPDSLAAYWPLRGLAADRPEPGIVRGLNLTVTGTAWADDPQIGGPDPLPRLHGGSWWYAAPAANPEAGGEVSLWGCGAISFGGFRMTPRA